MSSRVRHPYCEAVTITVTDGVGEANFAALTKRLGSPEFPNCRVSSLPVRMRQLCRKGTIFAYRLADVASVALAPGVDVSTSTINRAHFIRVVPIGDPRKRRWRGHGRPPMLRGSWIDLASAIAGGSVAVQGAE